MTSLVPVRSLAAAGFALYAAAGAAQTLAPAVARYAKTQGPVVLEHVRVIDGTGAPALPDRTLVLRDGLIAEILAPGATCARCDGALRLDLSGQTVLPGIVGMHDHLYYIARPTTNAEGPGEPPTLLPQMTFSAPRLYLAGGVTTLRTTGSVEPYTDLNLRREIDAGHLVGPHMDVTGPYLEGDAGNGRGNFLQMHNLTGPDDARKTVNFWADQGVTSFKAYMHITRAELKAAIEAAHARGLKVTGHLCSITYPEAADLGIDDLEHGFRVNTQLDPGKVPDVCPPMQGNPTLDAMDPGSAEAKALIALLVSRHVAVTSTLPVFESDGNGRPPLRNRMLAALSPASRDAYLLNRDYQSTEGRARFAKGAADLKRLEALERAFVAAGGLLLAGPDPTGDGHVLPGFGDQREIELLVEGGFTPVEAIRIATLNGAIYMGRDKQIGSIAVGKHADLLVVKGDPSTKIADIEDVQLVFKDGVGYDSAKLLDSVRGLYGQY